MTLKMNFDLKEALHRENVELSVLDELRNSNIPGMPSSITDHQILCFYRSCKYDFSVTRKVIENFYETKRTSADLFANRDPTSLEIQQCLKNQNYFYLPITPDGRSIVYHRLTSTNPFDYCFDNAIKTYFMTIDACVNKQGPRPGIIFLFDMENSSVMHLTRVNIRSLKRFFYYVNECLPIQYDEAHILNAPWFFDKVMTLIRPFMNINNAHKIFSYPRTDNCASLLKNIIPVSCIPSDYGGELESIDELHTKFCAELVASKNWFKMEEEQWNAELKKNKESETIEESCETI